ncbi:hypothetical protein [Pseudomonas fluorescens]|nr:hypothetical protein [Pseudomonas fluorescens]
MVTVAAQNGPRGMPGWYFQPYPYVLVDQDLRAALAEFGQQLGLVVVLSDKVHGRSRGNLRAESAGGFLTLLSDANHLTWYFDGNVLYVHNAGEVDTRLFNQKSVNLEQLTTWLNTLDVSGKQLSVWSSPDGNELFVYGPPPYLALVQQHVDQQQPKVAAPVRAHVMRVYRGSNVSEVSSP